MVELGDTVRCKYTKFKGVAVARIEFINGCVQIEVASEVNKYNKLEEPQGIDENSLEVINPPKKKIKRRMRFLQKKERSTRRIKQ